MRSKIAAALAVLCLAAAGATLRAQGRAGAEYRVDPPTPLNLHVCAAPGAGVVIEAPKALYASRPVGKAELGDLLRDYDPERAAVRLYAYYTLRFPGRSKSEQRIRVPYYTFQDGGTSYSLDTVLTSGDTLRLRFGIPAPQGHAYEVALNVRAARIIGVRYTGQGGAGGFVMCRDYAGKPLGTPIVLNHVRPGGLCYNLSPEFEERHFLGRGISPANRSQLIVVDESFRTLRSYQLRYRIREIESGAGFYVIFDDPALKAEASEVKLEDVLRGKRYLR